jgi:TolA-binding protein
VLFRSTPLSAGLRNGHRDLSVTLDGYTGVNERIQLGEDERLRRVFELDRVHGEKLETDDRQQPPSTRPRGETRSSAAELLVVAQERRMAQDWPGAARSYREIIEAFPQSREAASASVSLGGIELRQLGQPARALGSFQRYLKAHPRDGLAPEALFGKAQALRALRREVEERAALAAFLRKFPSAVQVPRVRARLDAIR